MKIDDKIIEILNKKEQPASEAWLVKNLKEDRIEIKKSIQRLLGSKKLIKYGKLYTLYSHHKEKIKDKAEKETAEKLKVKKSHREFPSDTGTIDAHPDGFAFFMPDSKTGDFFVPAAKLKSAVHGDRVRVKKSRFRGRIEAHVVEILERKITTIVGRIESRRRHYLVYPLHRKFTHPLFIRKGNTTFKEDDVVVCRIISYPDSSTDAEGEVIKVLGNINDKGIENLIVMSKYELTRDFPAGVIKDADIAAKILPGEKEQNRKDFTDLFTVTIDGETAKDFDDAISVVKTAKGYELYVHIADVAHYVKQESDLDAEAYRRGTSVYFPEFAIPMLPEQLSNGVCSLQPGVKRFAVTVKITYSSLGNRVNAEYYESIIRSDHRLTYKQVNGILDGDIKCSDKDIKELIYISSELMEKIKQRRIKNGTIDFDLPDVEFIFNDIGEITDIVPELRGISERIIENFMIESNEVVAQYLDNNYEKAVYRNHGDPEMGKVMLWAKILQLFGLSVGTIPSKITPDVIQTWFDAVSGRPYSYFLKSLLVRSMQRAEYSAENYGHFGLASEYYTHFTSPIRRYPDLIAHRLLKSLINKRKNKADDGYLMTAAAHCSVTERNADDAEREVTLYKKLAYLKQNAGKEYQAYINRVVSTGFYVFVENLMMTGYIDSSTLPGKSYVFDTEGGIIHSRKGGERMQLGDQVDVVWLRTDMDTLEASFMLYKKGVQGEIVKKKISPVKKSPKKDKVNDKRSKGRKRGR